MADLRAITNWKCYFALYIEEEIASSALPPRNDGATAPNKYPSPQACTTNHLFATTGTTVPRTRRCKPLNKFAKARATNL
ncbi:MAG: hypothetical protein PHQ11_01515 [Paludibacter sp.]|nr:hypothetical protein [Paludibacter sp.]MDD4198698.1 hypothetical protein [Paludibacter sp.]MDD4427116.1 hypothetical protein [Paludibacter sp.]